MSCRRELADKVSIYGIITFNGLLLQIQLDIQELKSILKYKQEELHKLEQEIEHELAAIPKPVQLTNSVIT